MRIKKKDKFIQIAVWLTSLVMCIPAYGGDLTLGNPNENQQPTVTVSPDQNLTPSQQAAVQQRSNELASLIDKTNQANADAAKQEADMKAMAVQYDQLIAKANEVAGKQEAEMRTMDLNYYSTDQPSQKISSNSYENNMDRLNAQNLDVKTAGLDLAKADKQPFEMMTGKATPDSLDVPVPASPTTEGSPYVPPTEPNHARQADRNPPFSGWRPVDSKTEDQGPARTDEGRPNQLAQKTPKGDNEPDSLDFLSQKDWNPLTRSEMQTPLEMNLVRTSDPVIAGILLTVNFGEKFQALYKLMNPPSTRHPWMNWLFGTSRLTKKDVDYVNGVLKQRDKIFQLFLRAFTSKKNRGRLAIMYNGKIFKDMPFFVMPDWAKGDYSLVMLQQPTIS